MKGAQHDTHQLLLEHQVSDLTAPAGERLSEGGVELARARAVRGALAHLQLDEELTRRRAALGEHLGAVDAHVRVLERAVSRAHLFEARDAGLDEVLGDAHAAAGTG